MAYLILTSRSRRPVWALAGVLALACVSQQVPIGEQDGSTGGSGGAGGPGSGGAVATGSGGTRAPGSGGAVAVGSGGARVTGSGGAVTTGSGGAITAGSGGSPGSGGASAGPDAGASGGTSGADAGGLDAGTCATAFASALASLKDCSTTADCTLAPHNDCCGTVVVAVRTGTDSSFTAAQDTYHSCVPGCDVRGCDHAPFAEDGLSLTASGQAFAAECRSGRCTSTVTTGSTCTADSDCGPGQICAGFVTNIGPTTTTTLACRGNPCAAAPLSCACAASVCTGFYSALCLVNAGHLFCEDGKQ